MIQQETIRIEKIYEPEKFVIHPLRYLQRLKEYNERCIDILRGMCYYFNGDNIAISDINRLLLITDRDKYIRAINIVYESDDMK